MKSKYRRSFCFGPSEEEATELAIVVVRVFSALLPLTVLFFGLGQNGEHASLQLQRRRLVVLVPLFVVQVEERGFVAREARTKVSWSPSASSHRAAASPQNGQGSRRKHHRYCLQ